MSQQRKAPSSNAKPPAKTIFNARAVADRLADLKAAGDEDSRWWTPALKFDWASARKGNNGTQWFSVNYTDENGIRGRLIVRINGEKHVGQIMPSTDAGVAELSQKIKNPKITLKKRDKKPSIQIQKWAARVVTADDGVTITCDDDGQPLLPGDEHLSPYYQAAALVNEAFLAEANERVERGAALLRKAAEMKKADRAVTAREVRAAFDTESGSLRAGDLFLTADNVAALRRLFAAQADIDLLTKGAVVTSNTKIASLVQEYISMQASKNQGLPLPNPMTRIAMNFDQTTGMAQMAFFDKDEGFVSDEGKQQYEHGRVDGEPINADNVHKFVLSRSGLDGLINMDSVCFSNMGISIPVKAEILVVEKPSDREVGLDDVYEDGGCASQERPVSAPPPAAPGSKAPPAAQPAAPPAAQPEDNYDDLLADLAGAPVGERA